MTMESSSGNSKSDKTRFIGPEPPPPLQVIPSDVGTPDDVFERVLHSRGLIASSAIRHVQRVSKRAALATKAQIWDSNDASIVAAQSAVNQWEQGYNALRGLLMAIGNSARGVYGAAKAGATGLEHGFLLPIRDWVLLPAFFGVERIAGETVGFLQSEHAEHLAHQSLDLVRQVPFLGESILAPALCIGVDVMKKTWEIAQYPIPNPQQVKDSVEFVMEGTKWVLTTAGREFFLYVKRADANITRTLSHTQWKVLGSGPYATLDKLNKREVIDHLCERYFSLVDAVARYELAAHIRAHNRPLYHDLVLTGLLRERGGDLTSEDEWLSSCPSYRDLEYPFLLEEGEARDDVFALWFRLPYQNGQRPGKVTPWIRFDERERRKLESQYRKVLTANNGCLSTAIKDENDAVRVNTTTYETQKYATNARWYDPDPENDLLLDQKRHAVSIYPCCPKCRKRHERTLPPRMPKQFGELCHTCSERNLDAPWVDALLSPPPLVSVYRPTMWRFYGPGDEIRRATWFLDTQRHGLQPYGEDAQAVLEDSYLFLKWTARRRVWDGSVLLTVQVPSPDGSEQQLVQFSSLTLATAIGKGLGAAMALFKRRVYRGAHHLRQNKQQDQNIPISTNANASEQSRGQPDNETRHHTEALNFQQHQGDSQDDQWVDLKADEQTLATEDHSKVYNDLAPGASGPKKDLDSIESDQTKEQPIADLESTDFDPGNASGEVTNIVHHEVSKGSSSPISRSVDDRFILSYPLQRDVIEPDGKHSDLCDDGSDDVDHLVLIVHGIGEMLQVIDLFGLSKLPTIVDCCGFLRKNHAEVLETRFNQLYEKLDGMPQPRRGRVEYLPVEWHESFTIQSRRRLVTSAATQSSRTGDFHISDISLRTIPQLRQFANDTLMDVLYFMSPVHHDIIIDIVVNEMNYLVERFRSLTGFKGQISVVGHSLGSIITWDILDNQLPQMDDQGLQNIQKEIPTRPSEAESLSPSQGDGDERLDFSQSKSLGRMVDGGSDSSANDAEVFQDAVDHLPKLECKAASDGANATESRSNLETLSSTTEKGEAESSSAIQETKLEASISYPQLTFDVDNAFMLGSPIAVFLMIRNQSKPLSHDFALRGCSRVFNIFHPYDPVAYRIEPLLDPRNAEIEPKIMTHFNGGFRFQYQTKRLWRQIVEHTLKTQESVVASLESGIAALGLLDGTVQDAEEDDEDDDESSDSAPTVVTGCLNQGNRIDYMLQEREIENANEYVAALAAHSSYWLEKDLSLFIARQIFLRALERASGDGPQ